MRNLAPDGSLLNGAQRLSRRVTTRGKSLTSATTGRRTRPARYSAFDLMRRGLTSTPWPRTWREHDLAPSYDVVIIGAGVHGLATAYYLAANHGITNVAVLDKGYIGGGGSGRNTAIIRSNYLTPEGWPSTTAR